MVEVMTAGPDLVLEVRVTTAGAADCDEEGPEAGDAGTTTVEVLKPGSAGAAAPEPVEPSTVSGEGWGV